MASVASGTLLRPDNDHHLKRRHPSPPISADVDVDDLADRTQALRLHEPGKWSRVMVQYVNPLIVLAISAAVRLYRIDLAPLVMWDEAHFGKFGLYYLKREFYFDVHPPLGKLLVGLSGWLCGYQGQFKFDLGNSYDDTINFVAMRVFNSMFGIMCAPVAYKTAVAMGYSQWTVWLVLLLVCFEFQLLCLLKFILLDLFLLFFTVTTFYCLVQVHNMRAQNKLLKAAGIRWLVASGFSIGCVCSVKWVGLFVTALVGLYTVYDLILRTYEVLSLPQTTEPTATVSEYKRIVPKEKQQVLLVNNTDRAVSWTNYFNHWGVRILTLIVLPLIIYLILFKVHFMVLNRLGSGDGLTLTLFQLNLEGNQVRIGPRDVVYGSMVTLRSQGLLPNLLHSHQSQYPEGSNQQQITTYGFRDGNNDWLFEFPNLNKLELQFASDEGLEPAMYEERIRDGSVVRLIHRETLRVLRANDVRAPVLKLHLEVSCHHRYDTNLPDGIDFDADEWVVELKELMHKDEDPDVLHPILTSFRLRNRYLGCYLATTGLLYPLWGFGQGEVVCQYLLFSREKSTWWNIEDHANDRLPRPEEYVPPKPKFWKEFVLLNYAMMALNNALIPDPDKYDRLALRWWQWPTVNIGLRMGLWLRYSTRYFLIGHPFVTLFSTLCLVVFAMYTVVVLFQWRRQQRYISPTDPWWNSFLVRGILPFLGWFLNYYPFCVMGRVTYVHHYVPAQYFATFVMAYVVNESAQLFGRTRPVVYGIVYAGVVVGFWYYRHLVLGMKGPTDNYEYLRLFDSWMI